MSEPGARIPGPTSAAKRVSRTRGPARRAHRRPATPRPAAATTPPGRRQHGGKSRRTGVGHGGGGRHGRRSAACPAGEAEPQVVSGVRRLPAATTSGRPRRRHPSTASRSSWVSGAQPPFPILAQPDPVVPARVMLGPADQAASRRTRSETARASVRPLAPHRRPAAVAGGRGRQGLGQQAAVALPQRLDGAHAQVIVHPRREHRRGGAQLVSRSSGIFVTRAMAGRFITRISASGSA